MIRRFSSRQDRFDHGFLRERLRGAKTYDRIAGYFRSTLLELVYEEIAGVDKVRIVCNSDLDPRDISVARTAAQQAMALREKWAERPPAAETVLGGDRYKRLHELLVRGNLGGEGRRARQPVPTRQSGLHRGARWGEDRLHRQQ
jgi:hypothetical protein